MTVETVLYERRGDVAIITLNRPDSANAVDLDTARLLGRTIPRASQDGSRAVVLAGAGARFCAGGDIRAVLANDRPEQYLRELVAAFGSAATSLAGLRLPVIAAVHGAVAGAGLALVLSSDIVVAARSTRFSLAYAGAGLTPDCGVSYMLPRAIGLQRALDFAVSGRELTTDRALEWGLVTHVSDDDQQLNAAVKLATRVADGPVGALAQAARLLRDSFGQTRSVSARDEARTILRALDSPDALTLTARFRADGASQ